VVLDFKLDQIGDLSLYLTSKVLMGWAIVVGPLCDHRAHVKVVAREQDFHPFFIVEAIVFIRIEV